MIDINDIIKFSDYKNIYIKSDDCFVYKTRRKKYNIKGVNVQKYISPIFYELFQPNFISDLFQYIKDKFENEKMDDSILENDFLHILSKLYKLGIIQIVKKESLSGENETMTNNFKMFNIDDNTMNDIVKSKNITIVNFLDLRDAELLLVELSKIPFNKVKLINFYPDILDITKEKLSILDNKKIEIVYEKYSNVSNLKSKLSKDDFLVTLHSANNVEINLFINKFSVQNNTPWLNCIVNDEIIEIGPLVVAKKTACYNCYKYNIDDEKNNEIFLKTYRISRRSNLYIAFGYVLDQMFKFLCHEYVRCTPITVNNIIMLNGLKLSYNIEPILKLPNCKTCGQ